MGFNDVGVSIIVECSVEAHLVLERDHLSLSLVQGVRVGEKRRQQQPGREGGVLNG